jgi:hypothetical protein
MGVWTDGGRIALGAAIELGAAACRTSFVAGCCCWVGEGEGWRELALLT